MICQLSTKSAGKWAVVKTDAGYLESEAFALKQSGIFVVKMTDEGETGYFTNDAETFTHYEAKGLICFLVYGARG